MCDLTFHFGAFRLLPRSEPGTEAILAGHRINTSPLNIQSPPPKANLCKCLSLESQEVWSPPVSEDLGSGLISLLGLDWEQWWQNPEGVEEAGKKKHTEVSFAKKHFWEHAFHHILLSFNKWQFNLRGGFLDTKLLLSSWSAAAICFRYLYGWEEPHNRHSQYLIKGTEEGGKIRCNFSVYQITLRLEKRSSV